MAETPVRRKLVWRYLLLVVPIVALFPIVTVFVLIVGLGAMASTVQNPDHWVAATATVTSVSPGQITNSEEIAQAKEDAQLKGLSETEAYIPEPVISDCTINLTFVTEQGTTVDASSGDLILSCEAADGDTIDIEYDPNNPTHLSYPSGMEYWTNLAVWLVVLAGVLVATAITGLVLVIRGHLHNRRVRLEAETA